MPAKQNMFSEVTAMMVSFDLMPREDSGVMQRARYDLSRMKGVTKHKNAISKSNAYRVFRSEGCIRIEFLDVNQPEGKQIKFRFVYQLTPPIRGPIH